MMDFYVYLHHKKDTNEVFYIGKGKEKRAYVKNRRNPYWKNIVNKHGYYVTFLKQNITEKEAFDLEMLTIKQYKEQGIPLTNMTDGGEGLSGIVVSEETRKKLSLIRSNISEETREKLRIARKGKKPGLGKKQTPESNLKRSLSLKGRKKPPRTEEHKRKIGEAVSKSFNKKKELQQLNRVSNE